MRISRPISVSDSIAAIRFAIRKARKSLLAISASNRPFSLHGRYISSGTKRAIACRTVNRKKFSLFLEKARARSLSRLDPVDSRIRDATNQTEHLVHGTPTHQVVAIPEFLTALPHTYLSTLARLYLFLPRCLLFPPPRWRLPRHSFPFYSRRRGVGKSPRFSWLSQNHGLRKVAEQRRVASIVRLDFECVNTQG